MNCCITERNDTGRNAGAKAPRDAARICAALGWRVLRLRRVLHTENRFLRALGVASWTWKWLLALLSVRKGERVLYQYPMYFGQRVAERFLPLLNKKGVHPVLLIHDVDYLRGRANSDEAVREAAFFDRFDYIICHNARMKSYLMRRGISADKLIELGLFDYLAETTAHPRRAYRNRFTVMVAGNLDPVKCSYIDALAEANPDLTVRLYGQDAPRFDRPNIAYAGSYSPEELPGMLDAGFGIVWDGTSADGCKGPTGEYLRYNNPHKLSLYLIAALPVIVWREAATAELVEQTGCGLAVDSLLDLRARIEAVSEEEYLAMALNSAAIAARLKDGAYLREALLRCGEEAQC